MSCQSRAHAVALLVEEAGLVGCSFFLRFSWWWSLTLLFSNFFSSSLFFSFSSSFFSLLSFQSDVHYASSNNFGAAHRQMLAEGKTKLKLRDCEYRVEKGDTWRGEGEYFVLDKPTKIYGQGCGKTTLVGFGLAIECWMEWNKSDGDSSGGIVEIEDLTIKGAEREGLLADSGMDVIMRGCSIEDCQWDGVHARNVDISCDDLQVVGCGSSGVCALGNATITLSGQGTSIQGNGTNGDSQNYGLETCYSSSKLKLVAPLTKEEISKKNGGGRNWGGDGTIEQVSK